MTIRNNGSVVVIDGANTVMLTKNNACFDMAQLDVNAPLVQMTNFTTYGRRVNFWPRLKLVLTVAKWIFKN